MDARGSLMRISDRITRVIDWFYIAPVASFVPRQLFRYAACGGINFLLLDPFYYFLIYNYVVAHRYFDLGFVVLSPHIAAMLVVFPITFFNGFWLNRNVAFRGSPVAQQKQLFRYALTISGSLLITYVGMKFFVEVCGVWPTPSKIATTFITMIYSFLAAKFFTFRNAAKQ